MTLTARQSTMLQMVNSAIMLAVLNYVVNIEHRLTVLETSYHDSGIRMPMQASRAAPPSKPLDVAH